MTINFETLAECPYCGAEFNKLQPNYNFCSYNCYREFTELQKNKEKWIPNYGWILKQFIFQELWWRGYRPSLNWHRWSDEDEIFDEFVRLMERDK